ncbi:MAG: hypothetical protein Kow00120_08270 [Anaerolineae bacterium]
MAEGVKLITFLGIGNYEIVTYRFGEHETRTEFAAEALARAHPPTQALVFLTREARKHINTKTDKQNWPELQARLAALTAVRAIDIPAGRVEAELWDIFDKVVDAVDERDTVVFDITFAFRSLPFITFLAIAYLRVAKKVDVRGVYYGAYEARENDVAPIFDLTPFVTLLDWTTAVDRFLRTGNAAQLAGLLRDAHRQPYLRGEGDLPRRLQGMANTVETLSEAMLLARPLEVMPTAHRLGRALDAARDEALKWARPFALLLDQTRANYAPFALPDLKAALRENLQIQLRLIKWYLEHERVMQAILLSREWIISLVVFRLGRDLIADRQEVEDLLNTAHRVSKSGQCVPAELAHEPRAADIIRTWGEVRDLRNDLLHAGMRADPRPASSIVADGSRLHTKLAALAPDLAE